MCGRFGQFCAWDIIKNTFGLKEEVVLTPCYNIAPTQQAAVIRMEEGVRKLSFLRWGLIPKWVKDISFGAKMINARSETVSEKPLFKSAFKKRRLLIPMDGFYEWKKSSNGKQPYFIQSKDRKPMAIAGLWERWSAQTDNNIESFTVLTCIPNSLMKGIHNRMPVILGESSWEQWLEPDNVDTNKLESLLQPFSANSMEAYPVSRYVNSPINDNPEIITPVIIEEDNLLFKM